MARFGVAIVMFRPRVCGPWRGRNLPWPPPVDARADLGAGGRGESILIGNDVEQRRSSQLNIFSVRRPGFAVEIARLGGSLQR